MDYLNKFAVLVRRIASSVAGVHIVMALVVLSGLFLGMLVMTHPANAFTYGEDDTFIYDSGTDGFHVVSVLGNDLDGTLDRISLPYRYVNDNSFGDGTTDFGFEFMENSSGNCNSPNDNPSEWDSYGLVDNFFADTEISTNTSGQWSEFVLEGDTFGTVSGDPINFSSGHCYAVGVDWGSRIEMEFRATSEVAGVNAYISDGQMDSGNTPFQSYSFEGQTIGSNVVAQSHGSTGGFNTDLSGVDLNIVSPESDEIVDRNGTTTVSNVPVQINWDITDFDGIGDYAPLGEKFNVAGYQIEDASIAATTTAGSSTTIVAENGGASWNTALGAGTWDITAYLQYDSLNNYYPRYEVSHRFHVQNTNETTGIGLSDRGRLTEDQYFATVPPSSCDDTSEADDSGSWPSFSDDYVDPMICWWSQWWSYVSRFTPSHFNAEFTTLLEIVKTESPAAPLFSLQSELANLEAVPTNPGNLEISMGQFLGDVVLFNSAEAADIVDQSDIEDFMNLVIGFFWLALIPYVFWRAEKALDK